MVNPPTPKHKARNDKASPEATWKLGGPRLMLAARNAWRISHTNASSAAISNKSPSVSNTRRGIRTASSVRFLVVRRRRRFVRAGRAPTRQLLSKVQAQGLERGRRGGGRREIGR